MVTFDLCKLALKSIKTLNNKKKKRTKERESGFWSERKKMRDDRFDTTGASGLKGKQKTNQFELWRNVTRTQVKSEKKSKSTITMIKMMMEAAERMKKCRTNNVV